MEILQLLDRLEAVITGGSRVPLTGRTVIDEHECLEIVDQLRVAIPEEVKQAKRLQADRERILQDAQDHANRVISHAQSQAANMVDGHDIVRAAEGRARVMLEDAQLQALERREGADQYALQTLSELERRLAQMMAEVQNGIRELSRSSRIDDSE